MICFVCQSLRVKAFELNLVPFKSSNGIVETFLLIFFKINDIENQISSYCDSHVSPSFQYLKANSRMCEVMVLF